MDREPDGVEGLLPTEDADVETASDGYARRFAGPIGAWFLEVQGRSVLDLLHDLPPGSTILDVGGGHAQLTQPLVSAGYAVSVLGSRERSGDRLARQITAGQVRFDVGDLSCFPYADSSFDAALSVRLLPHHRWWRRLVSELCRVARVCVIVDYPSIRSVNVLAAATFGLKRRVEGNTRPFRLFRPAEITDSFATAGFRVTDRRPQFLYPMVLHRMLRLPLLCRALEAPAHLLGLRYLFGSPIIVRADRLSAHDRG